MKRPKRGSASRGGPTPEDDDEALWKAAASEIEPLKRKSRVHAALEPTGPASKDARSSSAAHRRHEPKLPHALPLPSAKPVTAPPLADFDKRRARKIRSGQVDIERRIDLHGMRQSEAHAALRQFLLECHGQGRSSVLVITGKGAPRSRRDDDDLAGWTDREPGILKRQVPRWLAEPELRAIVVSYTSAAVQHGGEGALYVHLRRPRGD